MRGGIGIRSLGTCPGEIGLSVTALAEQCGTTEEAISRSLGDRRVRISREPPLHLALSAARDCLRQAKVGADDVDAIVWFGDQPSGLRLQHELGAVRAFTLFLGGYCSEMVPALRIARDLVRDGVPRVLIVSEDRYDRPYTARPPSERGYSDLVSDGGSAVLVEEGAALELVGFGFATRAHDWDYWIKVHQFHAGSLPADALPDPVAVSHDEVLTRRTALERCLRASRFELDEIVHFSLPERIPAPVRSLARQLGIPAAKVIAAQYGHMGRSDVVFDLARISGAQGVTAGVALALMTATTGVCRCAALRCRAQEGAAIALAT